MLVIGHRGARGLAPENTIESMHAAVAAGAVMLEFDIQITKDRVPVVIHDLTLRRTHGKSIRVNQLTARELADETADNNPVPTLEEVLDAFWGKIYLNIEVKGRGTGRATAHVLERYCKKPSDWENTFISSFAVRELRAVRKLAPHAHLGIIHNRNPFIFMAYYRQLNLAAVGWHRLYVNPLAVEVAKKLNLFTYAYTVNRPHAARLLVQQGIDGIVTDYPDKILAELAKNR